MIILNLIDKVKLTGEDDEASYGGSWGGGVVWRARLFLFVGFALMAGGLAGSIVSSIPLPWDTGRELKRGGV